MKKDVYFLASDECEGRGPTTKGIEKAADYIANEFKKAGLKPGNKNESYFQPFTIPGAVQDAPAVLKLKGPKGQEIELKEGKQFYPLSVGSSGKEANVPVVFAGYGTVSGPLKYDDYAGLDVEGKVVIVERDVPRTKNKETAQFPRQAASMNNKIQRAERAKAAAILFINDPETAHTGDDLRSTLLISRLLPRVVAGFRRFISSAPWWKRCSRPAPTRTCQRSKRTSITI